MDPNILNLITFLEGLAGIVAKGIVDLKTTISGDSTKTTDQILADADSAYQQVLANSIVPAPPASTSGQTSSGTK
jgi:hypothetical protein